MANQGSSSDIGFWGLVSLMVFAIFFLFAIGWVLYVFFSPNESIIAKIICGGVVFLLWQAIRADRKIRRGLKTTPNYAEIIIAWMGLSLFLWFVGMFVISMFLELSGFAKMENFLNPSNMIIWAIIVFAGIGWFFIDQLKQRKQK